MHFYRKSIYNASLHKNNLHCIPIVKSIRVHSQKKKYLQSSHFSPKCDAHFIDHFRFMHDEVDVIVTLICRFFLW